ncbi:MAG: hypothetical protein RLZZ135_2485 [Cyanobacteriota bacterium]|jgi:hypothetical protein
MCSVSVILSLCFGAMTLSSYSKPPEQINWFEEQFIHHDLKPLVLKENWYNYYKQRALFGLRIGGSVVITFALLNAAIFRANRRNGSNDRT